MAEPAQPKQPDRSENTPPGKGRIAEFRHGRGRPRTTVHKISLETVSGSLPGIHKISKR